MQFYVVDQTAATPPPPRPVIISILMFISFKTKEKLGVVTKLYYWEITNKDGFLKKGQMPEVGENYCIICLFLGFYHRIDTQPEVRLRHFFVPLFRKNDINIFSIT